MKKLQIYFLGLEGAKNHHFSPMWVGVLKYLKNFPAIKLTNCKSASLLFLNSVANGEYNIVENFGNHCIQATKFQASSFCSGIIVFYLFNRLYLLFAVNFRANKFAFGSTNEFIFFDKKVLCVRRRDHYPT